VSKVTYKIHVTGHVQGVGYRDFVRCNARELDVSGWVRNEADRSVSALLQADEEAVLEQLVGRLRQGPPGSRVDQLLVEVMPDPDAYTGFRVVHSS